MSLYHETAEFLTTPASSGGSLKSRIFTKKDIKSQPAQIYALAIESCKWSAILKEVIESAEILRLERKLTPILATLLVHDLLLAKRGIALPAVHGLRASVERHKNRLGAEFTKSRIRRKLGSLEALKAHIEAGLEESADTSEAPYPRWVRINTLRTSLEDQLETTFKDFERVGTVEGVRKRGSKRLFIDANIPNLVAISPTADLSKSEEYKSGAIIFQDKASCFPAYLLDPLPEDGDIIDTCSAPGNKTTHIAAILHSHLPDPDDCSQNIHAFEKNKNRAETLEKMVNLAGSDTITKLHPGQDFLKTDPHAAMFKDVGALLLDPSCSGSGIIGRDDMPELHLPVLKAAAPGKHTNPKDSSKNANKKAKLPDPTKETRKRKRDDSDGQLDVLVDDDGVVTAVDTEDELKARLVALSKFQLELLLHAFKFPNAKKITYSTCSIHAEENENVVQGALDSAVAKEKGWRLMKREEQIRGMREWPVRGTSDNEAVAEACIRANKGDEHGTMGFFLAGFVRDSTPDVASIEADFLRDERGHLVRDMMGFPMRKTQGVDNSALKHSHVEVTPPRDGDGEEWDGFKDEDAPAPPVKQETEPAAKPKQPGVKAANKHAHSATKKRLDLIPQKKKKRKK
ncbi:S-adenosyl-L-methionine-dependent methyltransferase [Tricladium varicosporioides]|nr:S-adenosyl-L-methionine-dependent methyltransferase [Hymenoscyphus varicosporioides]